MKRWQGENIFDAFAFVVAMVFIVMSLGYPNVARAVPLGVGVVTAGLGLWRLIRQYRYPDSVFSKETTEGSDRRFWSRLAGYYVWVVGFFILTYLAGFVVAIPVFAFLFLWVKGKEPWLASAALAIGMDIVVYLFFVRAVGIIFPAGVLLSL